jgi:nitrite reductase/ring-hydroxylating ferredoxin subunit
MSADPPAAPPEFDTGLEPAAIDRERPRAVETPWGVQALYRVGREILCAQAFCPHLGGPLFQGTLSGASITCPWHQWRYDLRSGARVDAARPRRGPGCEPLRVFAVHLSSAGTLVLRPSQQRG